MNEELQVRDLRAAGASASEVEEVLDYTAHIYRRDERYERSAIPLADEAFVEIWRVWAEQANEESAFAVLSRHLPQLRFPIREGMRDAKAYRDATLLGVSPDEIPEATGLVLEHPESLELEIYASPAGRIPLLILRDRADFESILRALLRRNEPAPVPPGQGASMVAGYNNWQRIHALRAAWEEQPEEERRKPTWMAEFARLRTSKESKSLYQDRFILLSDGPYSAVPAEDLGLDDATWREMSLVIRREHECVHYFTRRVFGAMNNHLLDELMADYAGLTAAAGRFHADWFLRFLGIEDLPRYREGTRIEIYRGDPPLSDGAFRLLHRIVERAARTLEVFDRERWPEESTARTLEERAGMTLALGSMTLSELAAEDGLERLAGAFDLNRSAMTA